MSQLSLNTPKIDLLRFVQWAEYPDQPRVMVAGVGKRGGQVGLALGNVSLKHDGGYEVVVLFDDGRIESFAPMSLFPAEVAA